MFGFLSVNTEGESPSCLPQIIGTKNSQGQQDPEIAYLVNDMMHAKWMCPASTQGIRKFKTFINYKNCYCW